MKPVWRPSWQSLLIGALAWVLLIVLGLFVLFYVVPPVALGLLLVTH